MSNMKVLAVCILLGCLAAFAMAGDELVQEMEEENQKTEPEKLEYAKGSVCGYCAYCKFCKLCDEDCPCEVSPEKPNCHMCKYCKYCYICSGVCETICQAGGVIDTVSAAFVNALPSFNKEEIDKDIDDVKVWIDKKKDEL